MIKQLKKVGNGQALFLDRTLMDLVGLEAGGEVQITVDAGSLIIAPTQPEYLTLDQVRHALDEVVEEYGDVLQRLAE